MAEEIEENALLDSKIKSVYRFLEKDFINIDDYYKFMTPLLPEGKVI